MAQHLEPVTGGPTERAGDERHCLGFIPFGGGNGAFDTLNPLATGDDIFSRYPKPKGKLGDVVTDHLLQVCFSGSCQKGLGIGVHSVAGWLRLLRRRIIITKALIKT